MVSFSTAAQIGEAAIGKASPGEAVVGYRAGIGRADFAICKAGAYTCNAAVFYRFIGNGAWTTSANWQDNRIPPVDLPIGQIIIIDPVGGGECLLNIAQQTIAKNADLRVVQGKRLKVLTKLVFMQ